MAGSEDDVEVEVNDGCIKQPDRFSYSIWQYFAVSNSSEAEKGGAKIAACKFVTKPLVAAVLPEHRPTFWIVLY